MSARARYEEVRCRTALNRVRGMGFPWSLNPYRGCVHGCHYCFARRFHAFYDLDAGDDFTGIIFVKTNVAEVLGEEPSRRSWKRELVSMGTATDPYQPIEGKYRLSRACLEAFARWRSPVNIVTKGTLIVRDVDVLGDIAARTRCTVCFSITTMDPVLCRRIEPGTPPPAKRLRALETLAVAGIDAGVLVAPIIPGVTDSPENLEAVVRASASHGARFLSSATLNLKPGTKQHFMSYLRQDYPDLVAEYRRLFPDSYAPKRLQADLGQRVDELKETYGLADRPEQQTSESRPPVQLGLTL